MPKSDFTRINGKTMDDLRNVTADVAMSSLIQCTTKIHRAETIQRELGEAVGILEWGDRFVATLSRIQRSKWFHRKEICQLKVGVGMAYLENTVNFGAVVSMVR